MKVKLSTGFSSYTKIQIKKCSQHFSILNSILVRPCICQLGINSSRVLKRKLAPFLFHPQMSPKLTSIKQTLVQFLFLTQNQKENKEVSIIPFLPTNESQINSCQMGLGLISIPHSESENKEVSIIPFSLTNDSQINVNQIDLGLVSIPHSKSASFLFHHPQMSPK